ncbi:DUF763 domain-containing protein [Candidatus Bathyarchaeota archaeon]|nr:MAG: DUF763 domain-containing protein [Candidatus Bathyarchaeota archaeon]
MYKTGSMDLILHGGFVPFWLLKRMIGLAKEIFTVVVDEFGVEEVLTRLSDPLFFQACSNVLGFDWDSSGSTTVTCYVLKKVFDKVNLGIKVAGGKGEKSRKALEEIEIIGDEFNISTNKIEELKYASRMTAKVDNTAIQAGYQIYHHTVFVSEKGDWTVIQQGLNLESKTARRYHWLSKTLRSFVEEPHSGIIGQKIHQQVLDMTSRKSGECRKVCVDLVNEPEEKLRKQYMVLLKPNQTFLLESVKPKINLQHPHYKLLPENVNWKALKEAYEVKPKNFEEFLALPGIGPSTIRGLALVAELIYGAKPSWEDPLKFSFAFGGKDGVPFPVRRKAMDTAIKILREAVEEAKIGNREKLEALKRLKNFAPKTLILT